MPEFREHVDRVKHAAKIDQRRQYKGRYNRDIIKLLCKDGLLDPKNNLEDCNVELLSECLTSALNLFFSECTQTKYIHQVSHNDLTVEDVAGFKDNCILGRSVGIEVLGRLFYEAQNDYDKSFNFTKISQLAQLDWSKDSNLWQGNIILENQDASKSFKVSTGSSAVKMAITVTKNTLGWV